MRAARRGLPREINRQIALNLVRARQPLSRADLARLMGIRRGAVSLIVNDLIAEGLLFEGATGETARGRKPTFLYVDSRRRCVLAVDIRPTRTSMMLTARSTPVSRNSMSRLSTWVCSRKWAYWSRLSWSMPPPECRAA